MGWPAGGIKAAHWPRGWLAQARHPRARPQKWESENKVARSLSLPSLSSRVRSFLRSFLRSPMLRARAFAFVRRSSFGGRTPQSTLRLHSLRKRGGGACVCAVVCVWREGEGGLVGGIERRRDTGRDTCAAISAQGVNLRANLLAHLRERERERERRASLVPVDGRRRRRRRAIN